ncbi:unnamed protein product [Prorocentrum cordatum]|uniref:HIT domain-containing protein n=1 Tax=Prorocentrum cordatum TaxID=2364126 RepID=A0ABN9VED6_9DINO|nr:unnamed protein product [Polarella glacialis]
MGVAFPASRAAALAAALWLLRRHRWVVLRPQLVRNDVVMGSASPADSGQPRPVQAHRSLSSRSWARHRAPRRARKKQITLASFNGSCWLSCRQFLEQSAEGIMVVAAQERKAFFKWARDALVTSPTQVFNYTKLRGWTHSESSASTSVQASPRLRSQAQEVADGQMDLWCGIWQGTTWARMVAARSVPLEVLQDAWQLQTPRVLLAKEPWKMVVGPAGALALQLRRLGWTASSAHLWRTRRGIALDLTEVSPAWVRTLALRDYELDGWRQWAQREEQAPEDPACRVPRAPDGYWVEPIRALFADAKGRAKWKLSPLAMAALRSTMIGQAFGPLPGHEQSVPRAELFAILKVLQAERPRLQRRAAQLTGIEIHPDELLPLIKFDRPSEQVSAETEFELGLHLDVNSGFAHRACTLMVYLNSCERGFTVFPCAGDAESGALGVRLASSGATHTNSKAVVSRGLQGASVELIRRAAEEPSSLRVAPQRGKACLFFNLLGSRAAAGGAEDAPAADPLSWHGGGAVAGAVGKWTLQFFKEARPDVGRGQDEEYPVFESFDDYDLKEGLLRGIYSYGGCLSATRGAKPAASCAEGGHGGACSAAEGAGVQAGVEGGAVYFANLHIGANQMLPAPPSGRAVAVTDLSPIAEGHAVVVPRRHAERLSELSQAELVDLWCMVRQVQAAVRRRMGATAFNIAVLDGQSAGQPVPHVHVHVVPRLPEDHLGGDRVHELIERWTPAQDAAAGRSTFQAPADEDRRPRTLEQMAEEAARYRPAALAAGGAPVLGEPVAFAKFTIPAASVFYQSASGLTVAFVNLKPLVPGHVLVVPKRVVQHIADLTDEELVDLFLAVRDVQAAVCAGHGADSANIGIQDGRDSGQTVPHVHVHVLPRPAAKL